MTEQKSGSECCKSDSKNCGCKKFVIGLLAGLALAVIALCLFCGAGGFCKKQMMCPVAPMQAPAR